MDARDRRFTSWLGVLFGPLFIAGGFLAAFTTMGALFIWFGLGMLVTGVLLRTRLPFWHTVAVGLVVTGVNTAYTFLVYPG